MNKKVGSKENCVVKLKKGCDFSVWHVAQILVGTLESDSSITVHQQRKQK